MLLDLSTSRSGSQTNLFFINHPLSGILLWQEKNGLSPDSHSDCQGKTPLAGAWKGASWSPCSAKCNGRNKGSNGQQWARTQWETAGTKVSETESPLRPRDWKEFPWAGTLWGREARDDVVIQEMGARSLRSGPLWRHFVHKLFVQAH